MVVSICVQGTHLGLLGEGRALLLLSIHGYTLRIRVPHSQPLPGATDIVMTFLPPQCLSPPVIFFNDVDDCIKTL